MKLSAPIYALKRKARRASRDSRIALNEALDSVAIEEGYSGWSLLAARHAATTPAKKLLDCLRQGDLVLIGARPRQGKTLMALELAVEAMKAGNASAFFTLEYTQIDILDRLRALKVEPSAFQNLFQFDCSDAINAAYIMQRLASAAPGALVVIDYLQLLDQNRDSPPLSVQVSALKSFARDRGLIMVFISQIDRSYEAAKRRFPDRQDIRLPNPLDLQLFDRMCFLNNGSVQMHVMPPGA
ncbi:DNA helicase [Pararhizobium antarcticum]|uniref:DNA helicase n=1 Tax=Pararhizobium antarcticum TaxID=1798805 RepID=A0A657LR49_9HYPH|nr:DNA helicase [Pararhizobium antarcticum]OJF92023.1 DNA helicase [Rhizobium sp. 58]OJF96024.1 DNA helicase [Pararhizobium antarcticum]